MKVLARITGAEFYNPIQGTERWPYIWEHKLTPLLRVCSTIPDCWDREWEVRIKTQMGKSKFADYPLRLDLQLHPKLGAKLPKVSINIEKTKGKFAHSIEPTLLFYGLPIDSQSGGSWWLMVSVVERKLTSEDLPDWVDRNPETNPDMNPATGLPYVGTTTAHKISDGWKPEDGDYYGNKYGDYNPFLGN